MRRKDRISKGVRMLQKQGYRVEQYTLHGNSHTCVSFHPFALESRRIHASIERPKKYHQKVPMMPQRHQAIRSFLSSVNITLKAKAEIGRSPKNRIRKGTCAGPLRIGLSETSIRRLASANKNA